MFLHVRKPAVNLAVAAMLDGNRFITNQQCRQSRLHYVISAISDNKAFLNMDDNHSLRYVISAISDNKALPNMADNLGRLRYVISAIPPQSKTLFSFYRFSQGKSTVPR